MIKKIVSFLLHPFSNLFNPTYLARKNKKLSTTLNKFFNGCEISNDVFCPNDIVIAHGNGIVIGSGSKIGKNVTIYQNTTLGKRKGGYPKIEDNVTIYPNCLILGPIKIGENSIIGAGTIVTKNIPKNSIVRNNTKLKISKRKV